MIHTLFPNSALEPQSSTRLGHLCLLTRWPRQVGFLTTTDLLGRKTSKWWWPTKKWEIETQKKSRRLTWTLSTSTHFDCSLSGLHLPSTYCGTLHFHSCPILQGRWAFSISSDSTWWPWPSRPVQLFGGVLFSQVLSFIAARPGQPRPAFMIQFGPDLESQTSCKGCPHCLPSGPDPGPRPTTTVGGGPCPRKTGSGLWPPRPSPPKPCLDNWTWTVTTRAGSWPTTRPTILISRTRRFVTTTRSSVWWRTRQDRECSGSSSVVLVSNPRGGAEVVRPKSKKLEKPCEPQMFSKLAQLQRCHMHYHERVPWAKSVEHLSPLTCL